MEMDRLLDGLARVMQPAQVGHWLKSPNPAFDGSTPLQLVERGEIDRIWRMLFDLESGQRVSLGQVRLAGRRPRRIRPLTTDY